MSPWLTAIDIGNEDLRAQIKTLQYELESFKQEREFTNLRHEKELRDAEVKAEAEFRKAQVWGQPLPGLQKLIDCWQAWESSKHVASHKHEALSKELKAVQDQAINQQHDLEKKLRSLQEENRTLKEDAEEAQTEVSSLDRQHQHRLQEIESKYVTLQQTLSDLRGDLDAKTNALAATQRKLAEMETETGHLESEVLRLKAHTGDTETLAVIKRELSEQVAHIRKLETVNREQNVELKQYRRNHKAVEVVEEEKRALETKLILMEDLRKELREAQLQRQILEDERQSWTSYLQNEATTGGNIEFNSPEDLARALVKERFETISLVERLGATQPELLEKEEIIKSLEEDRSKIQSELDKLRASGGGGDNRVKTRLERQRALAVKEIEYLREQLRTFDSEETTFHFENRFDAQKTKRIQDLESLVDQYRLELQTVSTNLSQREDNNPTPAALETLKRPREEEPDDRLGQLSRKNRKLQDTLSTLHRQNTILESDLAATKSHLTSLQKSSQTRILALRANPTADAEAIKLSTLNTLRDENKTLLAQLESPTTEIISPATHVPIASLAAIRAEVQALETSVASKEKMLLRLKDAFSRKALEFREAVASLLGWQMNFLPNGRVRMTSIFYPADEDDEGGNSLVFDGESGSMQISGGPRSEFGREVRGLIKFWVDGRKEIPGFLAAATLEFYEKTTRAARA